jgi:glycosyltransferase involved in cell wall biosynthesis
MKLCLVANSQSIHTRRWASHFVDRGDEVHVLSYREGEIEGTTTHFIGPFTPPTGVNVHAIKQLGRIVKDVKRILEDIGPDLVHAHYLQDSGFFAALSGFKPLVVSAWGSDVLVHLYRNRIYRLMSLYVIKKADAIHSVGSNLTKKLVELGAPKKRIVTVPMGVDMSLFNPDAEPMVDDDKVIISTRSLEDIYNVQSLIKASPYIIKRYPDARIIVAGDGKERETLQSLADELDVSSNVEFVGAVGHNEMPRWLTSAKVYVSTSLSDSLAVSNLEAMACGVFPVVTNIPACREWIKDGNNGFLVPVNNPRMLGKRIVDALSDDKLRDSARLANRDIIMERANWKDNMKDVEKFYKKVLKGAKK